jgi:hypothetical protein
MCAAEFFLQRPNFSEDLAENICQELATLVSSSVRLRPLLRYQESSSLPNYSIKKKEEELEYHVTGHVETLPTV